MEREDYATTENYLRKTEAIENYNTRLNMVLLAILKSEQGHVPDYDLFEYNEKNNAKLREVCEDLKSKIKEFKYMKTEDKKDIINKFYSFLNTYMKMSHIELLQNYKVKMENKA